MVVVVVISTRTLNSVARTLSFDDRQCIMKVKLSTKVVKVRRNSEKCSRCWAWLLVLSTARLQWVVDALCILCGGLLGID